MRAHFFTLLLTPLFAQSPSSQPVQLTATQDHQRMLDLLHITSLRPAPRPNATGATAANYDEAKANPWPRLPDPLVLNNGKPVTTPTIWWNRRRPELVELFDREVFGRVPANVPAVHWQVVSTTPGTEAGLA